MSVWPGLMSVLRWKWRFWLFRRAPTVHRADEMVRACLPAMGVYCRRDVESMRCGYTEAVSALHMHQYELSAARKRNAMLKESMRDVVEKLRAEKRFDLSDPLREALQRAELEGLTRDEAWVRVSSPGDAV